MYMYVYIYNITIYTLNIPVNSGLENLIKTLNNLCS